MRLEQHQQTIEFTVACSFQRRTDFDWVMAVVVDNCDVVHDAFDVEPASHSCELRQALANQLGRNTEIQGDCGRRGSIAHVMKARRVRKLKDTEVFAFVSKAEFAAPTLKLDVGN